MPGISITLLNHKSRNYNSARHLVSLKLLHRDLVIGIDAHLAGNLHSLFGDLAGRELGMVAEGLGCRLGIRPTAADGGNPAVGLDNVTLSAEQKGLILIA